MPGAKPGCLSLLFLLERRRRIMRKDGRENVLAVRLSNEEMAKVDSMCEATQRKRSDMIRWLIMQVELTGEVGLILPKRKKESNE